MRAIQLSIGSCGQTKLHGSFDIRLRSLMDFHSTELGTRHFSASLETVVSWINYQQSCHPITPPPPPTPLLTPVQDRGAAVTVFTALEREPLRLSNNRPHP